jgi:hypothetical protein
MREEQILNSIKRSVDQAPIDILENIKEAPRVKVLRHDEITRQDTRKFSLSKMMSYASIAAVFILLLFGLQYQTRLPDSYVYLDVNPSIEIVTNRMDKVIDLRADNLDGEGLIEGLEYKGKEIYQVTEEILDRMMSKSYLSKDHEFLLLSVYNKNQGKAEQQKQDLDKRIHEHLQARELQPIVLTQKLDNTSTIESYAKEYGISVSKMTFIRNLIILNPELQARDLADLSIEELVKISQGMGLELEKIIDSADLDRIQTQLPESEPEEVLEPQPEINPQEPDDDDDDDFDNDDDAYHQQPSVISPDKARVNRIIHRKWNHH